VERLIFQNDHYYHIINRGVDKRDVFLCEKDYVRFLWSLREFNDVEPMGSFYEKYRLGVQGGVGHPIGCPTPGVIPRAFQEKRLVEIVCYALLDNHFHMILKQNTENAIPLFMKKISGGYTNYFNKKYKRSGSLFQGRYKALEIDDTDLLLEKSLYVNGNAEIHGVGRCEQWQWSSCLDYLGKRNGTLANKHEILQDINQFEYQKLLDEYIREKKEWKKELKEMEME
jgi:REP element-mobilizing transposase RayT